MLRTPTPGYLFLLLTLTMKNTGTSAASVSSQRQFSLRDINGNLYDEWSSTGGVESGGIVAPGQQIKGCLVYEVPRDTHVYILQLQPGIDISKIVQWSLTL